jgi:hypothetical protein
VTFRDRLIATLRALRPILDLDELIAVIRTLSAESRHTIESSLTVLSLMDGRPGMPDPRRTRVDVTRLLARIQEDR